MRDLLNKLWYMRDFFTAIKNNYIGVHFIDTNDTHIYLRHEERLQNNI